MKLITFSIFILFISFFAYAQTEETPPPEGTNEVISIESPPDYSNVTIGEIQKKEQDIGNLLDQINNKIFKASASPSARAKRALADELKQLQENLQNEMKEYADMIASYNAKIATTLIHAIPPTENPATLNEIELKNKEKELVDLANRINQNVAMANRETTEEGKKSYIDQIDQLKNQFQTKKAQYFMLVKEYNKQILESMQLNKEEEQSQKNTTTQ
ncbi:MAG: hypothetical protein A2Y62_00700 [Candidatus Fischerbacteria bacterium RBG_13_37_8]|uniref:DUF5667 domain-containing protein n=1 Tax=Candidatus Fischerbacteria bacterium RBG_13_37_8 TaxID=1817863 RepID=A0A1F5VNI6_9BACT|nr:MAG: hypothetical protein A2Y62_00700 [Candidatus Fischerbacteria bacterium RBG_13_37_8]